MNGEETQDEIDRGTIWDMVFKYGPMTFEKICARAKEHGRRLASRRVRALANHEWFAVAHDNVYIAQVDGARRKSYQMGLATSST